MTQNQAPGIRHRGRIEVLASGSLRVSVYAGHDPLSKMRHHLTETVSLAKDASDKTVRAAWKRAEKIKREFIRQVEDRRHPRTNATVNQALDRYFDPRQTKLEISHETRIGYDSVVAKHIRPLLGHLRIADIDSGVLDSFDAKLRTCRAHCEGHRYTQHRTDLPHACDHRCGPHQCQPLGESRIRLIRAVLSSVFKRAIRWQWIGVNPMA